MRRIKYFPGCVAGILPLLLVVQSVYSAEDPGAMRKLRAVRPYREPEEVKKHRLRIEKLYAAQDKKLAKADQLAEEKKFKDAIALCEDVIAELELELASVKSHAATMRVAAVKKQMAGIQHKWGIDLLKRAKLAAADNRYDDGVALAGQAGTVSPDHRDEAVALTEYCRGMQKLNKKKSDTALRRIDPKLRDSQGEFTSYMRQAQTYFKNGKLTAAREAVEKAFVVNPYNTEAIALAGEIYRKLYLSGANRRIANIAATVAYATWQWNEPTFNFVAAKEVAAGEKREIVIDNAKLRNIIIPEIDVTESELIPFLEELGLLSKRFDNAEKNERYKGVSINHSLTKSFSDKAMVTLKLKNVPLSTVLDCICLVTGLKYEVKSHNNMVSVIFATRANEMISHSWDTPNNFEKTVTGRAAATAQDGNAGAGADAAEGGGNSSGEGSDLLMLPGVGEDAGSSEEDEFDFTSKGIKSRAAIEISSEELRSYFGKRGVTFPTGSSIYYSPRTRKLSATNTRANISMLDERIDNIIAAEPPLVMIEVKAVEISEMDFQDLGFDWTLGTLGTSNMDMVNGKLQSGSSGWMVGPGINTHPNGPFETVRGGTATQSGGAIVNNWNIFPSLFGSKNPFGSDIPLNISLTINALSRSDRTETLSAPKLVTQDNKRATVKMQTTYYFPESWDEVEVEVSTSGDNGAVTTIHPAVPEFNEDGTSLGIAFTVLPTIRKNRDIGLDLKVDITSYLGPDNYTVTIFGEQRYYRNEMINGISQPTLVREPQNQVFTIWRPIISVRSLSTFVDISDGETLVLGGMVENHTFVRVDKVPILGDLPLIGRFFQSQAENTERSNLLLFVTARLIDDHGMPIKRNHNNALPEYNR